MSQICRVFKSRRESIEKTSKLNELTTLIRGKMRTVLLGQHRFVLKMIPFIRSFVLGSPFKGMRRIATERADRKWAAGPNW